MSEDAAEICLSSITESTLKQYDSGLKLWWQFCKSKGCDIFSPDIPNLLDFLTFHFKRGVAHGTLNSYRSAISLISTNSLSDNNSLKRFFKGIFTLKPSSPKYDTTWDPQIVLDHLRNSKNEVMSLQDLAAKLATLLALTTAQRVQTLSLIDIRDIDRYHDGIEIKIPKRIKTSGRNRPQPVLKIPYLTKDPSICVVKTLDDYLERTSNVRSGYNTLFLTSRKPFMPATTQTVSRWIKSILLDSGLDTKIFSAHSTRHASTSAAARKGVSLDIIRRAAGWTVKSSTFANFYNLPLLKSDDFAMTILDV
uniref:Recombinase cre n=5 Tax=Lygus hesperus TaxID=30085 RepID=A0A0A9XK12_LYGHE